MRYESLHLATPQRQWTWTTLRKYIQIRPDKKVSSNVIDKAWNVNVKDKSCNMQTKERETNRDGSSESMEKFQLIYNR